MSQRSVDDERAVASVRSLVYLWQITANCTIPTDNCIIGLSTSSTLSAPCKLLLVCFCYVVCVCVCVCVSVCVLIGGKESKRQLNQS